ncbi:hypothetical protein AB6846_11555, partial [Serratia proteamaculans]
RQLHDPIHPRDPTGEGGEQQLQDFVGDSGGGVLERLPVGSAVVSARVSISAWQRWIWRISQELVLGFRAGLVAGSVAK